MGRTHGLISLTRGSQGRPGRTGRVVLGQVRAMGASQTSILVPGRPGDPRSLKHRRPWRVTGKLPGHKDSGGPRSP